MNRREQAKTDESQYSPSDSLKELALDRLQAATRFFSPEELAVAPPEQILSRMLSTRSYISTTSTLAEKNRAAQDDKALQRYVEIGKGQCGTVYALLGYPQIAKIPNSKEKIAQLVNDFKMHTLAAGALEQTKTMFKVSIEIPKVMDWVTPTVKSFWALYGLRFPVDVDAKSFAMISTRIYPVPLPVREAIVDALCAPVIQKRKDELLARPENKDCLIRVYLGRRETNSAKISFRDFRLRNFPLHVNEMENLQLDTDSFARLMAQTLAILHWKAGIDGNDVEFILGSSPKRTRVPPTRAELATYDEWSLSKLFRYDFNHRSISLWLIDFNL